MAVPTITSITPTSGHTGGQVLVEITGTGFQLDADPPDGVIPVPEPPQTVEVLFGTTPGHRLSKAEEPGADVWTAERLFVLTPKLDPYDQETVFSADPGTDTLIAAAHPLVDGEIVGLTTTDTLPAPLALEAGYRVINVAPGTFQLEALAGGGPIDITDAGTGTHTVVSDGRVDVTVRNIDETGAVIPGETVTAVKAWAPLRPNLSARSHMEVTLDTLIEWLRREVVAEVAYTTELDYDEENGEINIGYAARVPALLLTGLDWPKNREVLETLGQAAQQLDDPATAGNVVIRRKVTLRNLTGTIVGVSDTIPEMIALSQATSGFFDKNVKLAVPRDAGNLAAGVLRYEMLNTDELAMTPRPGDNISFFTMGFLVRGVRCEAIPGLPDESVVGYPATQQGEPNVGRTMTADGIVEITTLVIEDESA